MGKQSPTHRVYVIMGVSGSGKSVVANSIAYQLNSAFLDGDFLHPRANIMKMSQGQALNDDDRAPWLALINSAAFAMQRTHAVSLIVCSALKKKYRDQLRLDNPNLSFIYLKGDYQVIEERLKSRTGHFFKPDMLVSQFNTLEEPGDDEHDVKTICIHQPVEAVVAEVIHYIQQ